MEKDPILKQLIQKGNHDIPGRNLEDRIMEKVDFLVKMKQGQRKNLRISWFFLLFSLGLIPVVLIALPKTLLVHYLTESGSDLAGITGYMVPAATLIAAVLFLVQIDNLYRLTMRLR
ncbi:MAG: hypothetical protein JW801_03150 [Bacteroidales bacterium]|nr:hypothetical protein [Bacteroidales bacterium]